MNDLFGTIYEFLQLEEKFKLIAAFPQVYYLKQYTFDDDIIELLIKRNDQIIKRLLRNDLKMVAPCSTNGIFIWAIKKNYIKMVEQFSGVADILHGIVIAAEHGRLKIIKYLVPSMRTKIFICFDDAIYGAISNGHLEIVKYLISLPNLCFSTLDNFAVRLAAENGHLDIVKFLIVDLKLSYTDFDNYAFRFAAANGHLKVVKYLATLPGVNVIDFDNFALCHAAENGHLRVVRFLFNYGRRFGKTITLALDNYALRRAAENGHYKIVKFLVNLHFDPSTIFNYALRRAVCNGHDKVAKFLIALPEVQSAMHKTLCYIIENGGIF